MRTENEDQLEGLLCLAVSDPSHRPAFCAALLSAEVYVLGRSNVDNIGIMPVNLTSGSDLKLQQWHTEEGSVVIPFFTSLTVLQASIDDEQPFLALPAKSLFEMTMGSDLALNPRSDYGKVFTSAEIQNLLNSGSTRVPGHRVIEEETRVQLGQPVQMPAAMLDSLRQLFIRQGNVDKAWLALMHDKSVDDKPHLIIGIAAQGHTEALLRAVGSVAADTAPDGEAVDLYLVSQDDNGLGQYFLNQSEPFYQRIAE